MRQASLLVFLGSLALIGGETLRDIAKRECHDNGKNNALQPGNEYRYKVSSRATTEITGVSSDRGVVDVNCDVTVSNVRSCFYELQVKRCTAKSMSGAPGSETPIVAETELTAAAAHPVLFSLSHGHLHSVLAHKDDHLPGLNLKRGIISLLSVPSNAPATDSEGHKHEDVQGVCYRYVTRNGDNIRTVKDVNSCSEPSRMDWQLSPFSLFWNMSFARVLINSSNECDYTLQGDSLKKAICHERHAAMVHSNQETALSAQTNVHYELNLQETKKAKKAAEKPLTDLRVTSIQYEYERTPDPQSNPPDFKNRAEKMLSDLVIGSKDEVQLQNVDEYHNFIELLRTASDVLPFVKSVISCSYLQGAECNDDLKETSKQLLQGALVQCNSIACMKAVTHLTVYEHISPSYLNLVLYSWTHLAVNKPEYLDEILAICKSRDYRLCWLSLGIAIHTYTDRHPEALTSGQMPASITNTVNHLSSFLGQDCNIEEASFPPDFTPLQKYDYMRGIIKAIGNIGEAAHVVKPEVIQQLGRCARNNELHPNVRVAAVESIERMHSSQDVYRTLMGMLQDRSLPVDVRQASYIGLAEHITHYDISNDIAKLLKDEHITQVKTYIVSHLRNLIDKEHPSEHEQQFITQLNKALQANNVDLDDTYVDPMIHSRNERRARHHTVPSMPPGSREFGYEAEYDFLYTPQSALPYYMSSNITFEAFNELLHLVEVGVTMRDWESFNIWARRLSTKAGNTMKWLEENAFEVFQRLGLMGDMPITEPEIAYLDQRSRDSINNLKDSYFSAFKKQYPSLMVSLKMFGAEMDFGTLQDLFTFGQGQYFLMATTQNMGSLKDGLKYQAIRAARVLEGRYHRVTQLGVPLNFSSDITLMYSLKGELRVDTMAQVSGEPAVEGSLGYYPSAAGLISGSMIYAVPGIAKVGLQAVRRVYHSTRWELNFLYSEPSNIRKFSLVRSTKPQRYLEFYRTNNFIYGDRIVEIPDAPSVARVNSKKCTDAEVSKALGLELCSERSHMEIHNDVSKPNFPLAGSIVWKVYSTPYDTDLKGYTLHLNKVQASRELVDIVGKLEAPGSMYRRDVDISLNMKKDHEGTLILKFPENPDFEINLSRRQHSQGEDQFGVTSNYLVKLGPGQKYHIKYKNSFVRDPASSLARPLFKREGSLYVETPNNQLDASSNLDVNRAGGKLDLDLKVENKNPDMDYFKRLLPEHLWDTDRKAWLKVRVNSVNTDPSAPGLHRSGSAIAESPRHIIELSGTIDRYDELNRKYDLHLEKRVKANNEVLTFLHFLLDLKNVTTDDNRLITGHFNVTIPRRSVEVKYTSDCKPEGSKRLLTARRVKLIPKTDEAANFIGYWTPDMDSLFTVEERNLKFRMDLDMQTLQGADLTPPARADVFKADDPKMWGRRTVADVELVYPYHDTPHTVTLKGTFKRLMYDGKFLSWERDFKMIGTIGILDSKGHYLVSNEKDIGELLLDSTLVFHKTGKSAVFHLSSQRGLQGDGCYKSTGKASLNSERITMDYNHNLNCYPGNLEINLKTDSPFWDKLKTNLKYKAKLGTQSSSQFEVQGPLADIKGHTEWDASTHSGKRHSEVTGKVELVPSYVADVDLLPDGSVVLLIEVPELGLKKLRVTRKVLDKTKLERTISHIDQGSSDDQWHDDFYAKIKLYNPMTLMVRGWVRPSIFNGLSKKFEERLINTRNRVHNALYDPDHPLNKMLEPYLGMPIHSKMDEISHHIEEDWKTLLSNLREAVMTQRPIYYPYLKLYNENLETLREKEEVVADWYQEKSITGATLQYLGVHDIIRKRYSDPAAVRDRVENRAVDLADRLSREVYTFAQSGHHPFYWKDASKYPTLSKDQFLAWSGANLLQTELGMPLVTVSKVSLTGAGRITHIKTFDGVIYTVPAIPSTECAYLLAHDVRGSSFSIIAQQNAIKVVFPEVTFSISNDGKVYVNAFREETPLPFKSENKKVTASREGHIIKIETDGLLVLCDSNNPELCMYNIWPVYHGGVVGLLGNADGETYNDFMLPDGSITTDLGKFVGAYEIGDKQRCKELSARSQPTWSKTERDQCSDLGSESTLTYHTCLGFAKIKSEDVENACMWNVRLGRDPCETEEAAIAGCFLYGFRIMPSKKCSAKHHAKDEKTKVEKQVEVILVVNQKANMMPNGLKGVEMLTKNIRSAFEEASFDKIDFGLVGYNDDCEGQYIYSDTKDVLVGERQLAASLSKLQFNGQGNANPVKALRYAASVIPQSPTAMRAYLLFAPEDLEFDANNCNINNLRECLVPTVTSLAERTTMLGRLTATLKARGDAVFVFSKYPKLEDRKLYGVLADGRVLPRNKDAVSMPGGDAARLAQLTDGGVFEMTYVVNNQPPTFFKEVAREISKHVTSHVGHCRQCSVSHGPLWDPQSACVEVAC